VKVDFFDFQNIWFAAAVSMAFAAIIDSVWNGMEARCRKAEPAVVLLPAFGEIVSASLGRPFRRSPIKSWRHSEIPIAQNPNSFQL
jgi:hypothetical protein